MDSIRSKDVLYRSQRICSVPDIKVVPSYIKAYESSISNSSPREGFTLSSRAESLKLFKNLKRNPDGNL